MAMRYSEAVAIRARYPTCYLNPLRPEVWEAYDCYRREHDLLPAAPLRHGVLADMEQQFLYLLPAYICQSRDTRQSFLNLNYNAEIRAAWLRAFLCSVPNQAEKNAFQLNFAQGVVGTLCSPNRDLPVRRVTGGDCADSNAAAPGALYEAVPDDKTNANAAGAA